MNAKLVEGAKDIVRAKAKAISEVHEPGSEFRSTLLA